MICATFGISTVVPVFADGHESLDQMVADNVVGTFYHEFGHAVIDLWDLPIYGREEDAADNFSVLLIDRLYDDDVARGVIKSVAATFAASAETNDADFPYWDVHGTNEQRFFNTICIFVGLDPDNRQDFAQEMGLPAERLDSCPYEAEQVTNSWGIVFDELMENGEGTSFSLVVEDDSNPFYIDVLQGEIDSLNCMVSADFEVPILIKSSNGVRMRFSALRWAALRCATNTKN